MPRRRKFTVLVTVAVVMFLVTYGLAYRSMVMVSLFPGFPAEATYKKYDSVLRWVFWPAHQIDRKLRPHIWVDDWSDDRTP